MKPVQNTLTVSIIAVLWSAYVLVPQLSAQILSVSPTQNALHVPRNQMLTIRFNVAMDAATINETTFIVRGENSGPHTGAITYDSETSIVKLEPSEPFLAGEVVTAMLTNKIKSLQGVPFEGFTWRFTVQATQATPPLFREGTDIFLGEKVIAVLTADFDGDRDLDIACAKNLTSQPVVVLKNDGKGNFPQIDNYSLAGEANSIFGNDLDNDGDIDLVVATYLIEGSIAVLLNDGDGNFSEIRRFTHSVGDLSKVHNGDIDNDGDVDLIYASGGYVESDSVSGWVGVLLNDGTANFEEAHIYPLRNIVQFLSSADFNNDGFLDIAAGMSFFPITPFIWNSIGVLLNNGDGTFSEPVYYPGSLRIETIFCNDLDDDADIDAAVAMSPEGVLIYLNNGNGVFPDSVDLRNGDSIFNVWGADFDGDADIDLLVTENPAFPNTSVVRLYLNPGNAGFSFSGAKDLKVIPDIGIRGYGRPPTGGDLDNDGDVDLIVPFDDNQGSWLSFFINGSQIDKVEEPVLDTPDGFILTQNYPNPFNSETQIAFSLPFQTWVKLIIYNTQGKEVTTLIDQEVAAGTHELTWGGKNSANEEVASGIYLFKLEAFFAGGKSSVRTFAESKKMLFLK